MQTYLIKCLLKKFKSEHFIFNLMFSRIFNHNIFDEHFFTKVTNILEISIKFEIFVCLPWYTVQVKSFLLR